MRIIASVVFAIVFATPCRGAAAQVPALAPASRVVIPFLATESKPAALEFEGAECEANGAGTALRCEFQQVFLTSAEVPDTCLITTNRYERAFLKDTDGRWISRDAPAGVCGVMEVFTLHDGGGVRWTMEVRKVVTRKNAAPSCAAAEEPPETLSWQNLRRPLPCKFVQPGGLSR
jgi:hypothetical protein